HLTILVHNDNGYRNLSLLVSRAYLENFHYKPRIKKNWLAELSDGLIVLSGCLASELAAFVLKDHFDEADKLVDFYRTTFRDNFYFEIQPHNLNEQGKLNEYILDRAKILGVPVVVTNDCHYPTEDYHLAQEVLMCISTRKTIDDPTRLRHENLKLHLKTAEEIVSELGNCEWVELAIRTTCELAKRIDFEFKQQPPSMPKIELDDTPNNVLKRLSENGFQKKISPKLEPSKLEDYKRRLEFELDQIEKMGFEEYFLVVADFISWAKENGIPVGPGRGSVAGSLTAYLIGITELDPLEHGLLFERFLNPDRVTLPDIDVDFCFVNRDRVIDYVKKKYGPDKVAGISTFGTLKARAAIKDVGRVLGFSFSETEKIAQLIPPPRQGFDYSLEESLSLEPKLKKISEEPKYKLLIEIALQLEGLARHASKHAAGIVISGKPIAEIVPLMVDREGEIITQFSMHHLEENGLIKYDFLGLETLTFIQTVIETIKTHRNISVDITAIPLSDQKTYEMLSRGDSIGVFQLESGGIREMLKKLKPSNFQDLVALLALYRPGPLESGMAEKYIRRKHGKEEIVYDHPWLEPILSETFGIILYQEQIMQIAQVLAGYSLAQADILRKAMGKKNPDEMQKQRTRFVEGANRNGISTELANTIFDQMETFARYGFNKSHSAAYALLSFRSAYLKAHYPHEFLAVLLSFESSDSEKIYEIINYIKESGIKIVPPCINKSASDFTVKGNEIIFGLAAIKGISKSVAQQIVEERSKANFTSFQDFLSRCEDFIKNKKMIEALVSVGCFDIFDQDRGKLLKLINSPTKQKGVKTLADLVKQPKEEALCQDYSTLDKLRLEKQFLGFYLSSHPLDFYSFRFVIGTNYRKITCFDQADSTVTTVAIVQNLKLKSTKRGERYATFILEDKTGYIEALCWHSVLQKREDFLVNGEIVFVRGKLQINAENRSLIVHDIVGMDEALALGCLRIFLVLQKSNIPNFDEESILNLIKTYRGDVPLSIVVKNGDQVLTTLEHTNFRVKPTPDLVKSMVLGIYVDSIEFVVDETRIFKVGSNQKVVG
ncbi:MAG: DNA polymerase III subunit alpha, partial [Deltaproteobacteria bacterium]|nr:DNA polymerase III subunit alpha [Deltaproteobacteria bacterium]